MFRSALRAVHAPEWPLLHVAAGLLGGVLVWAGWVWINSQGAKLLRRPAYVAAEDVSPT